MLKNKSSLSRPVNATRRLIPCRTIKQEHVLLSASHPMRLQSLEVRQSVAPHDHDYYEIIVIQAGTAIHQTEGYDRPLEAGSVVVIAPGQIHALSEVKDLNVTNIYYLAEWLLLDLRTLWEHDGLVPLFLAASLFRRPLEKVPVPQFSMHGVEWERCCRELDDAARELNTQTPSRVFLKSTLLKFMITLSRTYAREDGSRHLGFEFRQEIWTALDSIEESIRQSMPLSVEKLAEQSELSADHLSRIFKESTGWSPMDYFQRRRTHHACSWLLNPRHSITDVALALGFSDTAHFSRLFRRYQGCSPREYRNTYL
jgi:AraC-like DNA-binding protein/quercetin dioxygenase-like cupin family protein